MHERTADSLKHESSAYELILEEGAIKTQHDNLMRLGQRRLGSAGDKMTTELKTIQDLDRLNRLMDAVLNVSSWQELLATP